MRKFFKIFAVVITVISLIAIAYVAVSKYCCKYKKAYIEV